LEEQHFSIILKSLIFNKETKSINNDFSFIITVAIKITEYHSKISTQQSHESKQTNKQTKPVTQLGQNSGNVCK
jgi:hypothetical protein